MNEKILVCLIVGNVIKMTVLYDTDGYMTLINKKVGRVDFMCQEEMFNRVVEDELTRISN